MTDLNKPWYKKWWGGLAAAATGLFLVFAVALGFYFYDTVKIIKSQKKTGDAAAISLKIKAIAEGSEKNYWLGSADPIVTIVEFADFSCPYCQKMFPKLREIGQRYENEVKIIFRDYPVVSAYSANLAMAARCAGEQGLFWLMHDKLFLNQGVNRDSGVFELAKQIGADMERFDLCFNAKRYYADIEKDLNDGRELNVAGTPTLFVDNLRIEGDAPYETLAGIIEKYLK